MLPILKHSNKYILSSGCLVVFLLFLVGCGSSASSSSGTSIMNAPAHMANSQAQTSAGNAQSASGSSAGAQLPATVASPGQRIPRGPRSAQPALGCGGRPR